MPQNLKVKFLLISALVVFCVWVIYPLQEKIKLGLDLQGGIFLTLHVDMDQLPKNIKEDVRSDIVDRTIEIIRKRVDQFGVRRNATHAAKVVWRVTNSTTKMMRPDGIDNASPSEWILRRSQPIGKRRSARRLVARICKLESA